MQHLRTIPAIGRLMRRFGEHARDHVLWAWLERDRM